PPSMSLCSLISSPLSSFRPRHRSPPSSTLFPYTTLFRSPALRTGSNMCRRGGLYGRPDRAALTAGLVVPAVRSGRAYSPPLREEDRKSTRLNSSHVSISYAVFCLKKKNACRAESGTLIDD